MQSLQRVIILLALILPTSIVYAQSKQAESYDKFYDTLLLMNDILLDKDKILITREQFLEADSFLVNQKGLVVKSFELSALSLGNQVSLRSNGPSITESMREVVKSESVSYKFVYIKNIVLSTTDLHKKKPSTQTIKLIFSN